MLSSLAKEIDVMEVMRESKGFPRLIEHGIEENYDYLVITYLGRNLDTLLKKCCGKFTLPTIINIG